jgi:endonuclease YncB( thermonuclease family)
MNLIKALIIAVILFDIIMSITASNVQAEFPEIDTTARVKVSDVIDGDTFDAFPVGRIRLADVNAPEYNKTGYETSRNYLEELIGGKQVYLDVDDNDMDDSLKRLICVVYVRKNSTHIWNVNKKMIVEDKAEEKDYTNNEFDPDTWKETIKYPSTDLPEGTYPQLLSDYIQLKNQYSSLQTQYEQSISVLGLYQPLSYVLFAVSVILGVILIKQKL